MWPCGGKELESSTNLLPDSPVLNHNKMRHHSNLIYVKKYIPNSKLETYDVDGDVSSMEFNFFGAMD